MPKIISNDDIVRFEKILKFREESIIRQTKTIEILKTQFSAVKHEGTLEHLNKRLKGAEKVLRHHKNMLEFMRITLDDKDEIYRRNVMSKLNEIIAKEIPDNFPIAFHGTGYIGTVREIIKSGGLLTPEQKGENPSSYAYLIDVTYKSNIRVSLEFADTKEPFMPYGALFAFLPEDNEIENIISTHKNSEVRGGVNGVNFKDEPNRLYGLITTPENIELTKKWCKEYGWDSSKVFTHFEFIKEIEVFTKNPEYLNKVKKINIAKKL